MHIYIKSLGFTENSKEALSQASQKKIPKIIIELWLQTIIMLSLINSHCKMLASYSDLLVHNFSHRFFFYFFFLNYVALKIGTVDTFLNQGISTLETK